MMLISMFGYHEVQSFPFLTAMAKGDISKAVSTTYKLQIIIYFVYEIPHSRRFLASQSECHMSASN